MAEELGPTFEGAPLLTREHVEAPLNEKPAESTARNTFLGHEAAKGVKAKGEANIAIGEGAMEGITTGLNNIAIGQNAAKEIAPGSANSNIIIGVQAFRKGASTGNIAIGAAALKIAEEAGAENTAVGIGALEPLTTGAENTAVGPGAGGVITTGSKNAYVGKGAGSGSKTGSENVAIGYNTNGGGEAGKQNVYIGTQAGEGKKGSNSIYIGFQAGKGSATVSNALYIANNKEKAIIQGKMAETEAEQELGFFGHAIAKQPKVKGKRTAEFATVLETLCKGLGELGLIIDETTV